MAVEFGDDKRRESLAGDVFSAVVNGEPVTLRAHPALPLVDILRGSLRLTSVKIGCGIGRCGACAVLVDGKLSNSCLLMAYQAQGKSITTVEGLSCAGAADVPQALAEAGAVQCGYCAPGMAVAIAAFLQIKEPPGQIAAEALSGNLCRCTGYAPMFRAIDALIDARRPRGDPGDSRGARPERSDAAFPPPGAASPGTPGAVREE